MPSLAFYFATGFPGFILVAMGLSFGSSWHSDVANSPAVGIMVFIGSIFLLVAVGGFIRDLSKSYRDWRIEERDEDLDRIEREMEIEEREQEIKKRKKQTRKDKDRLKHIREFSKKKTREEDAYAHYNTSKDSPHSSNYVPESPLKRTYPKGFDLTKPEEKEPPTQILQPVKSETQEKTGLAKQMESFGTVPKELERKETIVEIPRVFISHSIQDKEILDGLKFTLESSGIQCYIAEHDEDFGGKLPDRLMTAIDSCDVFTVIITKKSSSSSSVNQEIGYAKKAGKRIIPLIELGVQVPIFLQGIEFVEFTSANLYDKCKSIANFVLAKFGKINSKQAENKLDLSKTTESKIVEIGSSTFSDNDYEEFIEDSLELKSLWTLYKNPKKYQTRNQLYRSFGENVDRSKSFYKAFDRLIELGLINKMDEKQYISKNKETYRIELTSLGFHLIVLARKEKITSWQKFLEKYGEHLEKKGPHN